MITRRSNPVGAKSITTTPAFSRDPENRAKEPVCNIVNGQVGWEDDSTA